MAPSLQNHSVRVHCGEAPTRRSSVLGAKLGNPDADSQIHLKPRVYTMHGEDQAVWHKSRLSCAALQCRADDAELTAENKPAFVPPGSVLSMGCVTLKPCARRMASEPSAALPRFLSTPLVDTIITKMTNQESQDTGYLQIVSRGCQSPRPLSYLRIGYRASTA